VRDLAERAEARASVAAVLGALLLAEPGPALADRVRGVPRLASFADAATGVDYERIFLRAVPPYESVFMSVDGRRGGAVTAAVADSFDDAGFTEHLGGEWRTAGADHLGLELRAHAHLVAREAAAWSADRPDEAADAVAEQRAFLADHLARWAEPCLAALAAHAAGTAYADVLAAAREFMAREIDALRPAPLLDGTVVDAGEAPRAPGPGRLTRHLLSFGVSGIWLDAGDIESAARSLGFPWRPMDGRGRLRQLVGAAHEAGEGGGPGARGPPAAPPPRDRHRALAETQSGAAAWWTECALRAEGTAVLLARVADDGLAGDDQEVALVAVPGDRLGDALDALATAGVPCEHVGEGHTSGGIGAMVDAATEGEKR
jgi:TorA maturation chaperone TorD